MKIAIVGTGYVGLVTGTCFAEMGIEVFCIDNNIAKINNLKSGILPIYEPGLDQMVLRNHQSGRLHFTTDITSVVNQVDIIFCAVGTPSKEDGSADLSNVYSFGSTIGSILNKYSLIVTKSTVPVGTTLTVKSIIREGLEKRGLSDLDFDVASNPEFLKEGTAIADFMHPDRVVVGIENDRARSIMDRLYKPFTINNYRMIYTDIPSSEMIKYAANAMLATRISFMNDIANLCEIVGADINSVRAGIGADERIGKKFLYAGCGYGGSCFPKDVKAIIKTAEEHNYSMQVLKAVERVNNFQKEILFHKFLRYFKDDVKGKIASIWGLAFKPKTDDIREAPSLIVIDKLLAKGVKVKVYDPVAMDQVKKLYGDTVIYATDIYDATINSDAIILMTEWNEFRLPSWKTVKEQMSTPVVFDGRNIYNGQELRSLGFVYYSIGAK